MLTAQQKSKLENKINEYLEMGMFTYIFETMVGQIDCDFEFNPYEILEHIAPTLEKKQNEIFQIIDEIIAENTGKTDEL